MQKSSCMVYITEWYRIQKFRQLHIPYWDQKTRNGFTCSKLNSAQDILTYKFLILKHDTPYEPRSVSFKGEGNLASLNGQLDLTIHIV